MTTKDIGFGFDLKTEPLTIYELGIAILYKLMTIIAFFSQKGEVGKSTLSQS